MRPLLLFAGFCCTALGVLGIILPVLPTTPFLLLAAFFFGKSSKRFHSRLLNHPVLGKFVKDFIEKRGITRKSKIIAVSMIWLTIVSSAVFLVKPVHADIALYIVAIGVTVYLFKIKTI